MKEPALAGCSSAIFHGVIFHLRLARFLFYRSTAFYDEFGILPELYEDIRTAGTSYSRTQ